MDPYNLWQPSPYGVPLVFVMELDGVVEQFSGQYIDCTTNAISTPTMGIIVMFMPVISLLQFCDRFFHS